MSRGKRTVDADGTIRVGGQYAGKINSAPQEQVVPPPPPPVTAPAAPATSTSPFTDEMFTTARTASGHTTEPFSPPTVAELDRLADQENMTSAALKQKLAPFTPSERVRLATSSNSARLLTALADDNDAEVRAHACGNIKCPSNVFEKAAYRSEGNSYDTMFGGGFADTVSEPAVRIIIASRPDTSPELLTRLSTDPNPLVRARVAANPSTLPTDLDVLSRDENQHVRSFVAMNPNTSSHTLDEMVKKGTETLYLLQNPNSPKDFICRTAKQARKDYLLPLTAENFMRLNLARVHLGALARNPKLPLRVRLSVGEKTFEEAKQYFPG